MTVRGQSSAISIRKFTGIPQSHAPIGALSRQRSVSHRTPQK
jgi:hypothetical protein